MCSPSHKGHDDLTMIYKVETIENNLRVKKNLVEEIRTDIKKIEEEIDILESQQKSMVTV